VTKKQNLELTWIGKENRPRLEPRFLLEDPARSDHARHRGTDNDLFDNRLSFGDKLTALKAPNQGPVFRVPKSGNERYPNLTVRKIPKQALARCEWGHDDYSLNVENLLKAPPLAPKAGQLALL
jgi:hypothetical protein